MRDDLALLSLRFLNLFSLLVLGLFFGDNSLVMEALDIHRAYGCCFDGSFDVSIDRLDCSRIEDVGSR